MLYDIIVFEQDEGAGGAMVTKQHSENGVSAPSRQVLTQLYAACDQKIKIIKEYPSPNDKPPVVEKTADTQVCEQIPMQLPAEAPQSATTAAVNVQQQPLVAIQAQPQQERYFSVGGIECKQIGNKIYQKQWVLIPATESDNYRLISIKTNKIVPIDGKRIEVKKWILIEEEN